MSSLKDSVYTIYLFVFEALDPILVPLSDSSPTLLTLNTIHLCNTVYNTIAVKVNNRMCKTSNIKQIIALLPFLYNGSNVAFQMLKCARTFFWS